MTPDGRMRIVNHRGEDYINRNDLLETIAQTAKGMANIHDRACAEALIRWLVEATLAETRGPE